MKKNCYKIYNKDTGKWLGKGFGSTADEAVYEWRRVAGLTRIPVDLEQLTVVEAFDLIISEKGQPNGK